MIWHSADINDIADELQVNVNNGLSDAVAHVRLKYMGENFSPAIAVTPLGKKLARQFKRPVIIIMIIACVISVLIEWLQPAGADSIWAVPVASIIITAITVAFSAIRSYLCEKYIADSEKSVMPTATVIRSGKAKQINAVKVVQGDIISLKSGDCIPADARLIKSENLTCNESLISGLQSPVVKDCGFTAQDITPISERANMVYAGCWVTHGTGLAIVTEIGENTESGKYTSIHRQPALNRIKANVSGIAKTVSNLLPVIMLILFIVFFAILRFSPQYKDLTMLTIANRDFIIVAALAVAASPALITNIVSVSAAIGLSRLKDKGVLITDSNCIDTLGKIDCVCIDKSAMTTNDMHAVQFFNGSETQALSNRIPPETAMVLRLAAACSRQSGDPIDEALIRACFDYAHIEKSEIDNLYPRLSGTPFSHETMMSVSVIMIDGTPYAVIKGAAESIVPRCDCDSEQFYNAAADMGSKALRVIAIAVKQLSSVSSTSNAAGEELSSGFSMLGLIGLADPVQSESAATVAELRNADINVIMLTGDSISTARSVAVRLGMINPDDEALTGSDISSMNEQELCDAVSRCNVFARITPDDKARIVAALQKNGKTVAATGSIAKDSESVRAADIGCAMGKSCSDVAKYFADVIITDNSAEGLLYMIKGGRNIFQSIRRSIHSALVAEISIIVSVLLGYIFYRLPIISATQILFVSLLANVFPVISLSYEKYVKLVKLDKRVRYDSCFDAGRRTDIAWHSVIVSIIVLLSFTFTRGLGISAASAAAMITLVNSNIMLTMSLRSRKLIIKSGLLSNLVCIAIIAVALVISVVSAFVPVIGSAAMGWTAILLSVALSLIPFVLGETGKMIKSNISRRKSNEQ